jgi:anionic cell wall polymer biosynthesis LytR-Cps2A-Psr (LCP) family protein
MLARKPRPGWLVATLLAFVIAGPGGLAGPVSTAAFNFTPWPWVDLLENMIQPVAAALHAVVPTQIDKGSDGRLTVLLVGSDWRERLAGTGERTDAMMIVTIDDQKQISAISLPRDVGNFPIGPNETFQAKVNGLFKYFKQTYGTRELALEHMRLAFQYAFGIEIDYVAYIRFTGVDNLVDQVGGVPVAVPYNIYDPTIVDDRTIRQHGAKFLQSDSTLMRGGSAPVCYTVGNPINWNATPTCNRALLYVRSRHGPGNNDWRRERRQQGFVFATINRVISRGDTGNLEALRLAALSNPEDFYTTLPTDPASVLALFEMLDGATMPNQAVLMPSTYASSVPGTSKQELKIDAVRALFKEWFAPLN